MLINILVTLACGVGALAVGATGTAPGFATGTTGGGNAAAVTPTSLAHVEAVLKDTTTRVINIDRIWDFTTYYGTVAGQYCLPYGCSNNPQRLLNTLNGCGSAQLYSTTVYKAGSQLGLNIGSNKTVVGIGANAGFKGIGITLNGVTNVIVQNIRITDLNHQYVWGGDGITIWNSRQIWIDHTYVARVGRQFVSVAYGPCDVALTNNYFDGVATYSTGCNGYHYWGFILGDAKDHITFAYNYIYHTSGRGPSVGANVHFYNNLWDDIKGHAFEVYDGSNMLFEGNYFNNAESVYPSSGAAVYYVETVAQADTPCTSTLGRTCEWNKYSNSTGVPTNRQDTGVLNVMKAYAWVKSPKPMSVSNTTAYVKANAGTGKI